MPYILKTTTIALQAPFKVFKRSLDSSAPTKMRRISRTLFIVSICIVATVFTNVLKDLAFKGSARKLRSKKLDSRHASNDDSRVSSIDDSQVFAIGGRPPLSSLIGDDKANVKGDVQFLLDFAIIGHAKTGTTTLMHRLAAHEEVQMCMEEVHSLRNKRPAELVSIMYDLPEGSQYKRGYKAPNDIRRYSSLEALQEFWPETKLIVGLRHPIQWFEASYNHQIRGGANLPSAETMKGAKLPHDVLYHVHLAKMGKTKPLKDPDQLKLLGLDNESAKEYHALDMPNKVFLYDVSQPFDPNNETRAEVFSQDLSNFIGLSKPLTPATKKERREKTMNICDDKYAELRVELLATGKAASKWIRHYFVDHPDVTVSSPNHFKKILKAWEVDPCDLDK